MSTISKTVIPSSFKEISNNHDRFHPQLARTGAVLPITHLDTIKREYRKWLHPITFLRWNTSCKVGVEAESELESDSIFPVRSRSWSRSHLKFVDSAALVCGAHTANHAQDGDGWRRGMHLGFCAGDPGSIHGRASGQASHSPHMGRLAIPLEQDESSSAFVLTDMVLSPQPTNHAHARIHAHATLSTASQLADPAGP